MHHYQDLIHIFHDCFESDYNTRLIKGDSEPIYLPMSKDTPYHSIVFAHGFFSSALHECAHWLIAGAKRRKQIDYGYWYVPDGRNAAEQALFQQVEVKPQALEWILSDAARFPFQFSIDNLNGSEADTEAFKAAVRKQALNYCEQGLWPRAQQFYQAIESFYSSMRTSLSLEK